MVKIEGPKRKEAPSCNNSSRNILVWINLGAWLVCMVLWLTVAHPVMDHGATTTTASSLLLATTTTTSRSSSSGSSTGTSTKSLTTPVTTATNQESTIITKFVKESNKTPPVFLVQSFSKGNHHDPQQQRKVLSFTTVPSELTKMVAMIQRIVSNQNYNIFDAIHINIPWTALRFQKEQFPSSTELLNQFPNDPRIIVNRLMDYGPMTRYFGALGYEQHPDTQMIVYDIDSDFVDATALNLLLRGSNELDPNAIWCNFGEDFKRINDNRIQPHWGTYESYLSDDKTLSWNLVYFCRGARGILIKPKHFEHFVLNATDYHHSCFWDDDRFISFQMGVLGFERKNIHTADWYHHDYLPDFEQKRKTCREEAAEKDKIAKLSSQQQQQQQKQRRRLGTLTHINNENKPDIHCTDAFMRVHPNLFPLATNATALCPT